MADDRLDRDAIPYALGAVLLGIVTLIVGDFALQWQPVPEGLPARAPLALLSGIILILGGLAALWKPAGLARLILPAFFALWVVALHIPNTIRAPHVGNLLGVAEILSLAVAGVSLLGRDWDKSSRTWLRILYGLCPVVFGISHFVYVDITASMVPGWIPGKYFWAQFTGAAHIAAGLAIMSAIRARIAAALLALMCTLFAVLLHFPRVVAAPTNRMEWTMLAIAISIAGAAWLVRRFAEPRVPSE